LSPVVKPRLKPLAFLAAAGLAGLSGCGFSPLYGQSGESSVAAKLDTVDVANIPERTGQELRLALQTDLHVAGAPTEQRYSLAVSFSISSAQIGEQQDTSYTRQRNTALARWTLTPIGQPAVHLAEGIATSEDALNIIDQQYFAQALETGTVNQQLANQMAAQITSQIAAYFKTHPAA
jgi:LPS-assembly lipoprotein